MQLFPQLGEYLADFILTFIAVEQQMEFIAGNPGTQGILWCIVCEASACLSDILIAPVMSIGIIGILEVVHVQHKQGSMLQLFWFGEKCFAFPLECLTVVEPGQRIIISFMLDAEPFKGGHRDVLDQSELSLAFLPDLQTEVTGFSVWP